jgi:TM2 domain-containing membrane protein YozV
MADDAEFEAIKFMNTLPDSRRAEFQIAFQAQKKNRMTALLLSLFLGVLGVDRFYLGQTALGVFKLATLGGCYVWAIIDWFFIMSQADTVNLRILNKLRAAYNAFRTEPAPVPVAAQPTGYGPPPGAYGPPAGYGSPPQS